MIVSTASGYIGPFKTIATLDDRLRCDNTDLPFIVIGTYEILEDDSLIPPPSPPPEPPLVVSPRQIRQALTSAGMRAAVEAGVAAADQATQDWYNYAISFEEDHPMISTIATALGITEAQKHAVFVLASTL